MCYHGITKGLPVLGFLHVSSHVPFIDPNIVSNTYNIYSPIGRGYGVWSTAQLLHIDYLKTHLGREFNYHEIIDQDNSMVSPIKLKEYTIEKGIDFKPNVLTTLESALKRK